MKWPAQIIMAGAVFLSSCATAPLEPAQQREGLPCRGPNPPQECLRARMPIDENVARGWRPDYPPEFWENQLRDADRGQKAPEAHF